MATTTQDSMPCEPLRGWIPSTVGCSQIAPTDVANNEMLKSLRRRLKAWDMTTSSGGQRNEYMESAAAISNNRNLC